MGDIYLELIKTGNVLFKNWNATIYCDIDNPNTMKVNFGISNDNQNIFAMRKYEIATINSINKTVKFLKDCHAEWLNHVNEKREEFDELNFFRIDQLVYLRNAMPSFANNSKKADKQNSSETSLIFDLLYNVNNSLNAELIVKANNFALNKSYELLKKEAINSKTDSNQRAADANRELIQELINLGFKEQVILSGVHTLNTTETDLLIDYCFENNFTDDSAIETDDVYRNITDVKSLNFDQIKSTILLDNVMNSEELDVKYRNVWTKFKEYLNCNFDEFVCLNHLGLVLKYLKSKSTQLIERKIPPFLEYNTPNLIICPQDEILKRALNIYRHSPEQPLPTEDEILYCNSATTHEQIELFWMRILNSSDDDLDNKHMKIYCLINVQDLLYDQAVKDNKLVFKKW